MLVKPCICFGICLSSKWFHLRLTFFLFSNLGLIITQQTSIHINCFMAGGWNTSCHQVSKMHTVGEGPGETLSALSYLSYLIDGFLTDIKHLDKTSGVGNSPAPFWCLGQNLSLSLLTLTKLCYTKAEWVNLSQMTIISTTVGRNPLEEME